MNSKLKGKDRLATRADHGRAILAMMCDSEMICSQSGQLLEALVQCLM